MVHSTAGIQSSTSTISVSVELCVLSFCFVELKMVNPFPINRPPPVCHLMIGCTANDPSIYRFSMPLTLLLRKIGRFPVPLIYFIICTNLAQSSLSGSFTLVVRNEIALQVLILACLVANNIFTTSWWNSIDYLALSFLQYSLTLKRISGASLDLVQPPVGYTLLKLSIIS